MNQHILCAIDLMDEDISAKIVKRGASLAGLDGASMSVITVIPDYGMTIVGSFFEEGTLKNAINTTNEKLHAFIDTILPNHPKIQHITATGNVYEQVLHAAKRTKADMIIIGAHKPDFKDYLIGPNAARVARHASASVLVLR